MLSYGVIALILVIVFRREVLRWRGVAELLAIGALFFVLHTGIDALVDGQYKTQVEESMKLAANTFLALGMLAAAQATRSSWSARWPTSALRRGPTPRGRGTASPSSGGSPVP